MVKVRINGFIYLYDRNRTIFENEVDVIGIDVYKHLTSNERSQLFDSFYYEQHKVKVN